MIFSTDPVTSPRSRLTMQPLLWKSVTRIKFCLEKSILSTNSAEYPVHNSLDVPNVVGLLQNLQRLESLIILACELSLRVRSQYNQIKLHSIRRLCGMKGNERK